MTKILEREILKFSVILPKELMVEINQAEEGGFWAKVSNFPGCVTQGEDLFELIENINDAVFTFLEIPKKVQKHLGRYVPSFSDEEQKRAQDHHNQFEKIFEEIVKKRGTMDFTRNAVSLSS